MNIDGRQFRKMMSNYAKYGALYVDDGDEDQ